ncbi:MULTISPECIES: hypothetical protein [Deinococcus]|uniref:Leucine rich repeat variant n=1 Tax=Deinococcus rufus TaxID=2136097 RepID=A0ABV7Z6F0_9DEIO|nr:hypothetical protein [Deinococcus sp. AB2017081]WQE94716.1 hypothetical protein U2P90_15095 [Deinococcus sp. AB2017081]
MPPEQPHPLNARLPATELANLSLSRDIAVRRAVAAHPNTSPDILGTLAGDFPAEVLGNPALPLLRLAQPGLLLRWPVPALLALLRLQDAPLWLLNLMQRHPGIEVQVALASHTRLGTDAVEALSRHPAWLIRARIAARPQVPRHVLQRLAGDPDDSVRLAVACRADLDAGERAALRHDPSRYVQQTLRHVTGPTVDT